MKRSHAWACAATYGCFVLLALIACFGPAIADHVRWP